MPRRHMPTAWSHFWRQIAKAFRNPMLLVLTFSGNVILLVCAEIFFLLEHDVNPNVNGFGDALWWAFVTITTVGYGDIVPHTATGRFTSVVLMLTGGVFFLSFIALLSNTFIELEFRQLEKEIKGLKKKLESFIDEQTPQSPDRSGESDRNQK